MAVVTTLAVLCCWMANCTRGCRACHEHRRKAGTKATIRRLETACELYERVHDKYPDDLASDLTKLDPTGNPYLRGFVPMKDGRYFDGWGNPIAFRPGIRNQGRIDLYSYGPNGKDDDGDGDDIGNW